MKLKQTYIELIPLLKKSVMRIQKDASELFVDLNHTVQQFNIRRHSIKFLQPSLIKRFSKNILVLPEPPGVIFMIHIFEL